MGLASYPEDASALFCGREQETSALYRLVRREPLTVLFGQSGLGKSSLLQAGLFPVLRREGFLPVLLRMDHSPDSADLVTQVKLGIGRELGLQAADAPRPQPLDTLWEYFHRRDTEFWSARNQLLTLVLVFDQFEELFTLGQTTRQGEDRGRGLVTALSELVENRPAGDVSARLEGDPELARTFNYDQASVKVLLSLREDYLPHLEALRSQIPGIVLNRLRLTQMTGQQALSAVLEPGVGLIETEAAVQVIGFVAGLEPKAATLESLPRLSVEPALLSVVCRELNGRRLQLGQRQITADLLAGTTAEILENFYSRSLADLPTEVRVLVEERLLTRSGYRETVALEDVLVIPGVTREAVDTLVDRRLLRFEEHFGVPRLELTHDVLTAVVRASRDRRHDEERQAEEKRQAVALRRKLRRTRWLVAASIGATLLTLVLVLFIGGFWLSQRFQIGLSTLAAGHAAARDADWASAVMYYSMTPLRPGFMGTPLRSGFMEFGWPSGWFGARSAIANLVPELGLLTPDFGEGVAFSQDGLLVAAGSRSGIVEVWSAVTGKELWTLAGPEQAVSAVAFSPDSRLLAAASVDGVVRLWDVRDRSLRLSLEHSAGAVNAVAFSPDGRVLASGAADRTIRLWSVAEGALRLTLEGHRGAVMGVAFSPDGHLLASAAADCTIGLWGASTGQVRLALAGHAGTVRGVAFSPDGALLASASADRTVRLWEVETGDPRGVIAEHEEAATAVAFSPDGRFLACGSADRTVRLYQVVPGRRRALLRAGLLGEVNALAFSPDSRSLAAASGAVCLWHIPAQEPLTALKGHADTVTAISFSPDGGVLASASADHTARLWSMATASQLHVLSGHQSALTAVSFGPDGDLLATGARDGEVRLWDSRTGEPGPSLSGRVPGLDALAFGLDGHLLAASTREGMGRVWSTVTGADTTSGVCPRTALLGPVAISPDGHVLASRAEGGGIWLTALSAGTSTQLSTSQRPVTGLAFSSNGRLLAATSRDNTVWIYDVPSRKAVPNGDGWRVNASQPSPMAFTPLEGLHSLLATAWGENSVRLLGFDGDPIDYVYEQQLLTDHRSHLTALAFCPSFHGTIFASGSRDGTVRVWPVDNISSLAVFHDYSPGAANLAFSPDGLTLAYADCDHAVRLWQVGAQGASPFYEQIEETVSRGISYFMGGGHGNEVWWADPVLVAQDRARIDETWPRPWLPPGVPQDSSFSRNVFESSWVLTRLASSEGEETYDEILTDFLDRGVDVDQWLLLHDDQTVWRDPMTPLMIASRSGLQDRVEILLEHGAQVGLQDARGATALHHAAGAGHEAAARKLIESGAALDVSDAEGWTPLMHAAAEGHKELVELLLDEGAVPGSTDKAGHTAVDLALTRGDTTIVGMLRAPVVRTGR